MAVSCAVAITEVHGICKVTPTATGSATIRDLLRFLFFLGFPIVGMGKFRARIRYMYSEHFYFLWKRRKGSGR